MVHDWERAAGVRPTMRGDTVGSSVTVNGTAESNDVEPRTLLVYYLRDQLGLTGTNVGCDTSSCGACTVHVNGESVKSCTMLALQAEGEDVTTIEGLAPSDDELHPMQESFREHHGLQGGYCTPGLVLAAADSFGAASRLIDQCVAYAGTREQFGRKIGEFQAVKHQIARLGTEIEPTRGLYWFAAYAWDHLPEEASHSASLAKAHITDRAVDTARMAVELHGGIGFTWECDVQMWFKRTMFNRAFLGTPEWLRERCATLAGW